MNLADGLPEPRPRSAVDAARLIREGRLTSRALVCASLQRIDEREASVGAWEHLDPEAALAAAAACDAQSPLGPLHGVPVGVKDIFDTTDLPTAYGSSIYQGHRPRRDAASVALLRSAGAIVLGKTVTTEFGLFTPGKTANPRNLAHTPGGSSSGSAAAVADGMVPLALGAQTGGSIIRPAAFCGIVGYKPTYGLIDRAGVLSCAHSLDTVGVFGTNVADAGMLTVVLTGRPELRVDALRHPPRIGLCRTHYWNRAAADSRDALLSAAECLASHGAAVSDVVLPTAFKDLLQAQETVTAFEAARAFAHERRLHAEELSPELRKFLEDGDACPPSTYDRALTLARQARQVLRRLLQHCDVLLTLSAVGEAPRGLSTMGDPLFNSVWTLLHAPCVHLPTATGSNGLPVGVQFVGPPGSDARVLAAAGWAETHLKEPPT